ncbi:hypothetical protein TNCV_3544261, partial [Trichonephila clavipes]
MREALKELKAILKWRNQYAGTVHRNSYAERSKQKKEYKELVYNKSIQKKPSERISVGDGHFSLLVIDVHKSVARPCIWGGADLKPTRHGNGKAWAPRASQLPVLVALHLFTKYTIPNMVKYYFPVHILFKSSPFQSTCQLAKVVRLLLCDDRCHVMSRPRPNTMNDNSIHLVEMRPSIKK